MRANSGVKIAVSTGARFSMMLFFASTSHAAIITPAAAPDGMIQVVSSSIESGAIGIRIVTVSATRTGPPSAMSV